MTPGALVLDLGNTQLTVGLYRDGTKVDVWRLSADPRRTSDEWAVLLKGLVGDEGPIGRAAIASVVPAATAALENGVERAFSVDALVVDHTTPGVLLDVEVPSSVGADRLANATGARSRYTLPVIVVDFGTATNFDVVDRRGRYVGGAIAPGLGTSADALIRLAARLPAFPLEAPERAIGKNTVACLQSGMVFGFAGLVDALVARIQEEIPERAEVVATGGYAPLLFEACRTLERLDMDLTIDGLWELLRFGDETDAH